jgi:hypothetical protein
VEVTEVTLKSKPHKSALVMVKIPVMRQHQETNDSSPSGKAVSVCSLLSTLITKPDQSEDSDDGPQE